MVRLEEQEERERERLLGSWQVRILEQIVCLEEEADEAVAATGRNLEE